MSRAMRDLEMRMSVQKMVNRHNERKSIQEAKLFNSNSVEALPRSRNTPLQNSMMTTKNSTKSNRQLSKYDIERARKPERRNFLGKLITFTQVRPSLDPRMSD